MSKFKFSLKTYAIYVRVCVCTQAGAGPRRWNGGWRKKVIFQSSLFDTKTKNIVKLRFNEIARWVRGSWAQSPFYFVQMRNENGIDFKFQTFSFTAQSPQRKQQEETEENTGAVATEEQ